MKIFIVISENSMFKPDFLDDILVENKNEIIGVAIAVDGWCKYYPFGHEGGGNLDKKRILDK